jgi:hypothetical protein
MDAGGKFRGQNRIYHAVALDPALPPEGLSHDIDSEMGLSAGPVAGMALMLVRLVGHGQTFRRESLGQLICDMIFGSHGSGLTIAMWQGQS